MRDHDMPLNVEIKQSIINAIYLADLKAIRAGLLKLDNALDLCVGFCNTNTHPTLATSVSLLDCYLYLGNQFSIIKPSSYMWEFHDEQNGRKFRAENYSKFLSHFKVILFLYAPTSFEFCKFPYFQGHEQAQKQQLWIESIIFGELEIHLEMTKLLKGTLTPQIFINYCQSKNITVDDLDFERIERALDILVLRNKMRKSDADVIKNWSRPGLTCQQPLDQDISLSVSTPQTTLKELTQQIRYHLCEVNSQELLDGCNSTYDYMKFLNHFVSDGNRDNALAVLLADEGIVNMLKLITTDKYNQDSFQNDCAVLLSDFKHMSPESKITANLVNLSASHLGGAISNLANKFAEQTSSTELDDTMKNLTKEMQALRMALTPTSRQTVDDSQPKVSSSPKLF